MDRLIEELLDDVAKPDYVPTEADGLMLCAWYLKKLSESLAK